MKVMPIKYHETEEWLMNIHYSKRLPSITYSFGLFEDNILIGIITYGMPVSHTLCEGICGKEYKDKVLELNRLCLLHNRKNEASFLVGNSLKLLPKPLIIVSFADTAMNHHGYIYQATNFIYTGLTDKHSEWRLKGSNLHQKNITIDYSLEERKANPDKFEIVQRTRKHRYIYFLGDKKKKSNMINKLNYKIKSYPKGDNKNYKVGYNPKVQGLLF